MSRPVVIVLIIFAISVCQAEIPPSFHPVFKFNCPRGFIQDGSVCLIPKNSSACPEVSKLNTLYSFTTRNPKTASSDKNGQYCRYPRDTFFATGMKGNSATLTLTFQDKRDPFQLFLDVNATYPIEDVEKRIYCWAYKVTDRLVGEPIPISKEFGDARGLIRYSLKLFATTLHRYTCCLMDPGKARPVISNRVMASMAARYIFYTQMLACWYTLQKKRKYHFISFQLNSTHDDVFGASNIPDINDAIDDFKKELSLECNATITNITNNKFCLPSTTGKTKIVHWPQTPAGLSIFSSDHYLDRNGKPLRRQCTQEEFGARWSDIKENCSYVKPPQETIWLTDIEKQNKTEATLINVTEVLTASDKINEYDIGIIANILSDTSKTVNISSYLVFFETLDKVHNIAGDILNSSTSFGSPEKILESAGIFMERLAKERTNISINYPNIASTIQSILARNSPNSHHQPSVEITATDKKTSNISVQLKLSGELLDSFDLSKNSKSDMKVTMITYKTNKLFPGHKIENTVTDIKIYRGKDELRRFDKPLSILFRSQELNVSCAFWDIARERWSTGGMITKRVNESTVECQTHHLTRFALLIIDEKLVKDRNLVLMIIWTIEAASSFIGVCTIMVLAVFSKKWSRKRTKTIHLSFAIFLEIILLWTVEYVPETNNQTFCTSLGVALHYVVLVKFTLTLLIAKLQLENFVFVMASVKRKMTCFSFSEIFTVWVIPAFVIAAGCVLSLDKYKAGKENFCYPKEGLFYYFLVLPVMVILLINLIAYTWILMKLRWARTKSHKQLMLQLKLAVMLWFMLGITWLFGVLANVYDGTLHVILYYLYSFTAPLQGVVIFFFSVCLDEGVKCYCGAKKK